MKYLFITFVFSLFVIHSCMEKVDVAKEKAVIKAVIEEERAAYFDSDFSRVEATWVNDNRARKIYMSSDGMGQLKGWAAVAKSDQENIAANDSLSEENAWTNQYLNYEINVYGNTAVVFHETEYSSVNQPDEPGGKDLRILHLVKDKDKWKIDLMALYFIPDTSNTESE